MSPANRAELRDLIAHVIAAKVPTSRNAIWTYEDVSDAILSALEAAGLSKMVAEVESWKHCYSLLEDERQKQHDRAEAAETEVALLRSLAGKFSAKFSFRFDAEGIDGLAANFLTQREKLEDALASHPNPSLVSSKWYEDHRELIEEARRRKARQK